MQGIILAAGEGKRLRPLTNDRPKCMVEVENRPIIDHILHAFGDIPTTIVTGYRADVLESHLPYIQRRHNKAYASTNMVESLFCAEDLLDKDTIISYADIVYSPQILQTLANASADAAIVIDRAWRSQWEERFADPLSDAETLKLDDQGNIVELGNKPTSYDQIEGQYVGLLKFSEAALVEIRQLYHRLPDTQNMYMTTFVQYIIDELMPVKAVLIDGGWREIDCLTDLAYDVTVERR